MKTRQKNYQRDFGTHREFLRKYNSQHKKTLNLLNLRMFAQFYGIKTPDSFSGVLRHSLKLVSAIFHYF